MMTDFVQGVQAFWQYLKLRGIAFGELFRERYPTWFGFFAEEFGLGLLAFVAQLLRGGSSVQIGDYLLNSLVAMGLWFALNLLWTWVRTPAVMYFDEKTRADRYGFERIRLESYLPPEGSVHRDGLEIANDKDVGIRGARFRLTSWIVDGVVIPIKGLPRDLAWMVGDNLVWNDIDIESGGRGLVAFRHWPRPREASIPIYVSPVAGAPDYGPSVGIEANGELGLPVYRDRQYRAAAELRFEVSGTQVTMPIELILDFDEERLLIIPIEGME